MPAACLRALRAARLAPSCEAYDTGLPARLVTPRLVAIDGPLKGSTFLVSGESFSIGRKPDNTLAPADPSISRRHCVVCRAAGGQFRLADLDSQNGTFVNGIPVKERELRHGDQIAAGASVFVFLLEDQDSPSTDPTLALQTPGESELRHGIIGESAAIKQVIEIVARVAPLDSTVLITGESGTGKELAARALHDNSPRASRPFVAINCATLSEAFLESELFGHERGAFTGAIAQKKGKLELAHGGTLFLDEVSELALPLQGKLLRVLQEREFERLGGTQTIKADLRLIAATNRDLAALVRGGKFRQDLYYRLRVISIEMPALRRRREDIPLLANYFRVRQGGKMKRRTQGISAAAKECLMRYDWPGNVRELQSAIESAMALGSTDLILAEDLPEPVLPGEVADDALPRFDGALVEVKRDLIRKAYQQAHGDYAAAAKALGLHPNSLLRLVRTLGLRAEIRRPNSGSY